MEWVCDKVPLSHKIFEKYRNELAETPLDEEFLTILFQGLKLNRGPPEGKIYYLELVVERFEKEIELLDSQSQPYDFQSIDEFLENLPSPRRDEIVSPFDLQIDEEWVVKNKTRTVGLASGFNFEDVTDNETVRDEMVIEGWRNPAVSHVFIDHIADYIEFYFSCSIQPCFSLQMLLHITKLVSWVKGPATILIMLVSSQEVHSFQQLLDWLYWFFHIA